MSPSLCAVQLIQHRCGRSIRGAPGLLHGPTVLRQPFFFSIAPADSQSRGSPPFSGDGRSPCGPTRRRKPPTLRQFADPNLGADPSVGSAHDPHLQTFSSVLVPTMAPVGEPSGNHPRGSGMCMHRTEPRAVVATAAPKRRDQHPGTCGHQLAPGSTTARLGGGSEAGTLFSLQG